MRSWIAVLFVLGLVMPSCTAPQTHTADDGGSDAPSAPDVGNDAFVAPDVGSDAFVTPDVGNDAAITTLDVSGTVVGLPTGLALGLTNGTDMRAISGTASGSASFSFQVAAGASYDIAIGTAPATLLCVVYRGTGTASTAVTNVFVGCSTSVDLYSWFPFDGNAHASRGADWTSMAGTLAYTTDRIGRTGYALDASDASVAYQLDHALDGRSSVAPQSTQLTVSMWARLPSSVTTTTTQNLFAHVGTGSQSAAAQVVWSASGAPSFQFYFYWDGGFAMSTTTATTMLARDEWHHLTIAAIGPAGTAAGAPQFVRAIYVDGVRQATTSTCCGWGNDTQYWYLGVSNVQRDDIRYYTRMLTDAEIAGIYAAEHVP